MFDYLESEGLTKVLVLGIMLAVLLAVAVPMVAGIVHQAQAARTGFVLGGAR